MSLVSNSTEGMAVDMTYRTAVGAGVCVGETVGDRGLGW
jgi:hypothetical protein